MVFTIPYKINKQKLFANFSTARYFYFAPVLRNGAEISAGWEHNEMVACPHQPAINYTLFSLSDLIV